MSSYPSLEVVQNDRILTVYKPEVVYCGPVELAAVSLDNYVQVARVGVGCAHSAQGVDGLSHCGSHAASGHRRDDADIGCGSVLNPGTIIGKNTQVYPLTMLRGAYPESSIVKGTNEVIEKR